MTAMRSIPMGAAVLLASAALGAACGGATQSTHATPTTTSATTTTTQPPAVTGLQKVVTAGRLTFTIPSSWTVGYGTCRCNWGAPDTAVLDNGHQNGGVLCSCPAESTTAPSALHLYEGQGGLTPGGRPTEINGVRATVVTDPSTATLTATFPGVDQWITIGPGPSSTSGSITAQQAAREREILATVTLVPGGGS
jgi:hypothetical protein